MIAIKFDNPSMKVVCWIYLFKSQQTKYNHQKWLWDKRHNTKLLKNTPPNPK